MSQVVLPTSSAGFFCIDDVILRAILGVSWPPFAPEFRCLLFTGQPPLPAGYLRWSHTMFSVLFMTSSSINWKLNKADSIGTNILADLKILPRNKWLPLHNFHTKILANKTTRSWTNPWNLFVKKWRWEVKKTTFGNKNQNNQSICTFLTKGPPQVKCQLLSYHSIFFNEILTYFWKC